MFTMGALVLIVILALATSWDKKRNRTEYDATTGEDRMRLLVLQFQRALGLIVHFLVGVIIMLGIIADRVH